MQEHNYEKLRNNLEAKGYTAKLFDTKELAAGYLKDELQEKTVGFGGSATLQEMNLFDILSENNTVIWHDKKPDAMTVMEARTSAAQSEIYISSVNGISEDGEIVNIDNTGNRVAAISYGPSKVYLILGENKIAPTLDSAIYRARNIAAPLNAKRLNRNTPCAIKGDKCYNCQSPERICRMLSVFWEKPAGAKYEVIIIKEALGF